MRSLKFAAMALVFPALLAAQAPQGQHMMGGMQGGGMLGAIMKFAPDNLLKMSDQLALTSDQVARLTALRDATAQAAEEAHHPAMEAHMSLNRALKEATLDTTAIRQYFLAHEAAESNMQWIRASAALQARALLTEAQRGLVK